jgi:hypothetical protein
MALFIQIENDQPVNHPVYDFNLIQVYGQIPQGWAIFNRVERPIPMVYQVLESDEPVYTKIEGVWTDVWSLRDMTDAEKAAKQQAVRDTFNAREQASNWSDWILDEATCIMKPPIPRPEIDQNKLDARIMTFWCGAEGNWKDTSAKPEADCKFDFLAWTWVLL